MFAGRSKIIDALRLPPAFARRKRLQPADQQKAEAEQQTEDKHARAPRHPILASVKHRTEGKRKGGAGSNCKRNCHSCRRETPRTATAGTAIPDKRNLFEQFSQADLA